MRHAVMFGAGNVGRGFLGQLLFEGGYHTTFVDANPALVSALNGRGEYPLRLVSAGETLAHRIGNLCALDARADAAEVTQAVVQADLLLTAVGVAALPHVAPALARGIAARSEAGCGSVDVLLCENQWHAATLVRGLIEPHLPWSACDYFRTGVGLVETVIGRMVPAPTEATRAEDPLLVVSEPYKELPIARAMLRGETPPLPGLIAADDFDAYEARKLFLHNAGHAALAYLGYGYGHEYVWQCADDPAVSEVCRAALAESAAALVAEYGFTPSALGAFNADLLRRFTNQALGDPVARVAADPLRKLRPTDRLIGAASLCLKHSVAPKALARVISAALRYDHPADASAQELQRRRQEGGVRRVLEEVGGVAPGSALGRLVLAEAKEAEANRRKRGYESLPLGDRRPGGA